MKLYFKLLFTMVLAFLIAFMIMPLIFGITMFIFNHSYGIDFIITDFNKKYLTKEA